MAHDVERRAGSWVNEQANRHQRSFFLLLAAYGVVFSVALVAWLTGHHVPAAILAMGVVFFGVAANRRLDTFAPWRVGANTEQLVGQALEALGPTYVVLHDVMFGGEGNLDHVVKGPNGVFLIETKANRYENRHLPKIKRQAKRLSEPLGCWVTPVICAGERKNVFRHSRVLIAGRNNIADAIRRCEPEKPASDDAWRRWLDSL